MATKKSGLGRGLDALFADNSIEEINTNSAIKLKLMDIEPNREQPRKVFDEEQLAELSQSIAEHGVIQPLLVRPMPEGGYQLVAGERRWRASRMAGLTEVPVVIRELSDEQAMAMALIENLQREDLNPVEEARGFQALMKKIGLTQEEAAQRVGKSRPAVSNSLRLLNLPESVLEMVSIGQLSAGHARALLSFGSEEEMLSTAKLIMDKELSVRAVERLARALKNGKRPEEKSSSRREAFFDEVELALSEFLGRKVKVMTKGGRDSGTIEIDFYDKEDLAVIANSLNSAEI